MSEPVQRLPGERVGDAPAEGIGLCLSGGGYRAMLFHLGALYRLNELRYLPKLDRISSVSGGSITAGVLGMNWSQLQFQNGLATNFEAMVSAPLRKLAGITIDRGAILGGGLLPGISIGQKVAASYRKYLFGDKTLQDLPTDDQGPRFVINATNVQTGALLRFCRPYVADYRVGRIFNSKIKIATAVAASSAFPPFLSPHTLDLDESDWDERYDLGRPPYTTDISLTDGGVYDNLGLETVWKNYRTVLVSDGGGQMEPQPSPDGDWARHSKRVLDLIDNQVRSLRKRQLIDSYKAPAADQSYRNGTYWGIRTNIADYKLQAPAGYPFTSEACPHAKTLKIAAIPTRLRETESREQDRLINWGYAVCEVAMRRHVVTDQIGILPAKYPCNGGIG